MLDEDNAWILAGRLEWYCHEKVPPSMQFLADDDGRFVGRMQACDWLLDNEGTGMGRKVLMWARNMRTPAEEAERLLAKKAIKSVDELLVEPQEKDPIAGYRRRYQEFNEMVVGKIGGDGR